MKIATIAIGRQKAGPETELVERYLKRAKAIGRGIGLTFDLREFPESRAPQASARKAAEADVLRIGVPDGAALLVLDERGRVVDSAAFAEAIAKWRDGGRRDLAIIIGGPDGLAESLRKEADLVVAFGALTLPHQLVRVLAAEQLYRAMTILSGHPYHRA